MSTEDQPLHRELAEASGVSEPAVLERLLAASVSPETFPALRFVPLVMVAWASGKVGAEERTAVLNATEQATGMGWGSPAYQLLERWLDEPPDERMVQLWADYYRAWLEGFDPEHREVLKQRLVDDASRVAKANGGVFGLGAVCPEEEAVIDRVKGLVDCV